MVGAPRFVEVPTAQEQLALFGERIMSRPEQVGRAIAALYVAAVDARFRLGADRPIDGMRDDDPKLIKGARSLLSTVVVGTPAVVSHTFLGEPETVVGEIEQFSFEPIQYPDLAGGMWLKLSDPTGPPAYEATYWELRRGVMSGQANRTSKLLSVPESAVQQLQDGYTEFANANPDMFDIRGGNL